MRLHSDATASRGASWRGNAWQGGARHGKGRKRQARGRFFGVALFFWGFGMRVEMNVSGLEGVLETLQSLPAEVVSRRGGPVKLALAKAARVIRDQAKVNLKAAIALNGDVSTGLLEKNVIASRGKEPIGTRGERYLVRVRRKSYPDRKGKAVTTRKTGALLEYGSSHQPATPWLRPAVKQKGQQAIEVFTSDLNRRIDATVKKLAQQNQGK